MNEEKRIIKYLSNRTVLLLSLILLSLASSMKMNRSMIEKTLPFSFPNPFAGSL
jgi:hypothetical protein